MYGILECKFTKFEAEQAINALEMYAQELAKETGEEVGIYTDMGKSNIYNFCSWINKKAEAIGAVLESVETLKDALHAEEEE